MNIIETERLTLEPLISAHAEEMFAVIYPQQRMTSSSVVMPAAALARPASHRVGTPASAAARRSGSRPPARASASLIGSVKGNSS